MNIIDQTWWLKTIELVKSKIKASLIKPIEIIKQTVKNPPTITGKQPATKAQPVNAAATKKATVTKGSNQKAAPTAATGPTVPPPPSQPNQSGAESNNDSKIIELLANFLKFTSKKLASFDSDLILIQAQLYLARVYSRLKDFNTAKTYYEKVIQKEPEVYFINKILFMFYNLSKFKNINTRNMMHTLN